MIRRFGLVAWLALVLTMTAVPSPAGSPPTGSPALAELAGQIIAEGNYQTSVDGIQESRQMLQLPAWLAGPLQVLMWIVLLVLLTLAALFLISMFRDRGEPLDEDEPGRRVPEGDPAWAEIGLRNADELARQGRTGEALHALLLAALGELRRRGGIEIRDSLTSREILARVPLPGGSEAPLRDLVREVEFAFFGARERGPEDYQRGRACFEQVRVAMVGEAA